MNSVRILWRCLMKNIKLMALISIVLFLSLNLFAEKNLILEINVQGNHNIDEELIKSLITFEVGEGLTQDNITKTYNNLYQLGVLDNIEIDKTELQQGISIMVNVTEYPIVNSVKYKGNKKVKKTKINENTSLKTGSYWSPFLESETQKSIKELYKKKGYHLASSEFKISDAGNNKVDVLVKVNESSKVTIKKIRIHGNKGVTTKKLLGKMKTKKAGLLRTGKFEKEQFDEDMDKIISYYNKKGYVDARIISFEKELVENKFFIEIYLYEGSSYKFGKVFVKGNNRFTEEVVTSEFKFKKNEIFNLEKFKTQLGGVATMYYEEGHIYSQFDHELEKADDRINIHLNITENTRAKVRKIHFSGNRKTKEKIVRRHLAISPGDYYQQSKIMQTQQNIYNLGFFEPDMYPDIEPINKNGDIDLVLYLNDKTSGSANGGIAINSQDGIVGQLGLTHNNILGNSWQAGVKWEFGGKTQNFTFNFTNPYLYDTNTLVGFDIYHTTKEWSTFKIQTNGGSVRFGRPVSFLNFGKLVFGYSLYSKKYEILDSVDPEDVSDNLNELDGKSWQNTSSVSATFSRDSRNNVFFPSSGSHFTLYNEFAGGPLLGNFDYYKQIAQVSWYTKTIWELVLRTKWRFGYVTGYNNMEVPPDERFYLGGTGPDGLRGYPDRSVGPADGGLREIIFSTEYAAPLAGDQIVGLLFFDAGNSFNELEDFNFGKMKKGGGMGIRIRSPLGLIGFDYAFNFDTGTWEPHFQFGTTF